MHRPMTKHYRRRRLALALLASAMLVLPVTAVQARSDASINAEISDYILKHPKDLIGQDKLVFKYTGEHITVGIAGIDRQLTAEEAQSALTGTGEGGITPMALPDFQIYVSSIALSGGGRQFWGTWDFPDWWAGQAAPVDLAQLSFQMNSCFRMSDYRIYTYSTVSPPGSTNLGTLRSTAGFTGGLWNVNDQTSGFQNLADRGTATITVKRGTGCPGPLQQVGAAFDYEANQGGGVVSVTPIFAFFSVSYSGNPLTNHLGTPPIYVDL